MDEFLLKREGYTKAKNNEWAANTRWLAFQVNSPHLRKGTTIDQLYPISTNGKKPVQNANEIRERTLARARESQALSKKHYPGDKAINNGRQGIKNKDRR